MDNYSGMSDANWKGIFPGDSQVCMFKLLSGLLNQGKMLPIRYMPLVIELELVDSLKDPGPSSIKNLH